MDSHDVVRRFISVAHTFNRIRCSGTCQTYGNKDFWFEISDVNYFTTWQHLTLYGFHQRFYVAQPYIPPINVWIERLNPREPITVYLKKTGTDFEEMMEFLDHYSQHITIGIIKIGNNKWSFDKNNKKWVYKTNRRIKYTLCAVNAKTWRQRNWDFEGVVDIKSVMESMNGKISYELDKYTLPEIAMLVTSMASGMTSGS